MVSDVWLQVQQGTDAGQWSTINPPRISLLMVTRKVLGVRLDPMRTLMERLPSVSVKIN